MKKTYGKPTRILSVLLAILLLLPTAALTVSAKEMGSSPLASALEKAGCDVKSYTVGSENAESTDFVPTIIVPGFGQSKVYILDKAGNKTSNSEGNPQPLLPYKYHHDYKALIGKLAFPLIGSLLTQSDMFLSRSIYNTVSDVFAPVGADENGYCATMKEDIYTSSMANCTEEQKSYIYGEVPLREYTSVAGEQNLYYFSYNSFGNMQTITDRLIEYVDTVKRETNSQKVNLCFISLGGAIADMFFDRCFSDEYATKQEQDKMAASLDEILFVIPAADGSAMFGDVYAGDLSTEANMLYGDIWTSMVDGYLGYLIGLGLRLLPSKVLDKVLDSAINALRDSFLLNCTMLCGLVPSGSYDALAAKYLSDDAHREIKRQTDMFHRAQLNMKGHLQYLMDNWGVRIYDMVEYDFPGYKFTKSWDKVNGDGLIALSSASFGAYSVPEGQTLPDGYVQQNTSPNNDNPVHNHISPDRVVDASTGLLPDTTWYFDGQSHEQTIFNGVIVSMLCKILLYDNITSVYSDPQSPQFMCGRNTKKMNKVIADAEACLSQATLTQENRTLVENALNEAKRARDDYLVPMDEFDGIYQTLHDALTTVGWYETPEKTAADDLLPPLTKFLKFLSAAMLYLKGGKGFFEL